MTTETMNLIITIVAVLVGIITAIIAVKQMINNSRLKKAEFLDKLYSEFNGKFWEAFGIIESEVYENIYNKNYDTVLAFWDKVEYFKKMKVIDRKFISYLGYELMITNNSKIQEYIKKLREGIDKLKSNKKIDETILKKIKDKTELYPFTGYENLWNNFKNDK